MPHYGILRDLKFDDVEDIRGADVYGVNDEKLGTIDDVIFNHSSGDIRYVVISTGLLSRKKFMVPANRISPYGNHDDKFYAELDKERLEMLPEFDDKALKSESDWNDYERTYEEHWTTTGDVLHHEQTGRIITPPTEEIVGTRGVNLSQRDRESLARDFTPEKRGKQDAYLGVAPSGDDITLRPNKPSIGGRKDVELMQKGRSGRDSSSTLNQRTVSSDPSLEGSRVSDQPGLQEPGIYKVDAVPEAEKRSDMNEPLNANYGPRWAGFQNRLREGRDKVVGDCPLCGTQKKVA